jgi:RNA polymerase sigma-70 factor (ECF subfamily)
LSGAAAESLAEKNRKGSAFVNGGGGVVVVVSVLLVREAIAELVTERDPPSGTVADAIARAKDGDNEAFAVVFERFAAMVHGVLLARVPRQDAEDLVQEVFETALVKLQGLRDPAALGPWLAAIARNRATDARRSASRRRTEPLQDDVPDGAASPSASAEAGHVLAILQELPLAYRETLVLRLVEGMSGPEIAAQVGMTADSVRVNLHRGMKLLKERLGEQP